MVRLTTCAALIGYAATLAARQPAADLVLLHGNVIPMTAPDAKAEAVAIKDGRILAIGNDAQIAPLAKRAAKVIDLKGRTLLPGFIDAHGHIALMAMRVDQADLASPPAGPIANIAELQAALRAQAAKNPDGWILGAGYDDSLLAEKRHPTRQELDAVSSDRPIFALHVSSHLAALNTKALELAGLLHPAADPPSGVIQREADGKTASGVIEESAMFAALRLIPGVPMDRQVEQLDKAQQIYASNGITSAEEGGTMPGTWAAMNEAAKRKRLFLD
ncbi:MAG: amidohydrolase family protein, partial [Proteobacteria bacterium]|nr:amidohydrolase family protein [Pseudomonadota bacterium]